MAKEIERKFLVRSDGWRAAADQGCPMRQAYLSDNGTASVRVRIAGDRAVITVKAARAGRTRDEFEYGIPLADAETMMSLCACGVEKTRFRVPYRGHVWEVDVYEGENEGLVLAEIELQGEDDAFVTPPWLGPEVTDEARFYASNLARRSFREWNAGERLAAGAQGI